MGESFDVRSCIAAIVLGIGLLLSWGVKPSIAAPPELQNTGATNATATTAVLTGTVKTDSSLSDCHFDYLAPKAFLATGFGDLSTGGSVPCAEPPATIPPDSTPRVVTAGISRPSNEPVYYRLVASNASGTASMPFWGGFGFGLTGFDGFVQEANGDPSNLAGTHPYAASFEFFTTSTNTGGSEGPLEVPTEDLENATVELPPGLAENPTAVATCTAAQLSAGSDPACPLDSRVGTVTVYFDGFLGEPGSPEPVPLPVFNMAPSPGTPALLGVNVLGTAAYLDASLRTGRDYGVTFKAKDIPETFPFQGVGFSLWGVPADPSHDAERGGPSTEVTKPFLSLPTACQGPLSTSLTVGSWQSSVTDEASFLSHDSEGTPIGAEGCNAPDFSPELQARPTTNVADSPSGLAAEIRLPRDENPFGTAEAQLRDATIELPQGLFVNPAAANGLRGCPAAGFGVTSPLGATPMRTTPAAADCPDASRLGSVQIDTPRVDRPLEGAVYLAEPYENPFRSLFALYAAVEDPATGIVIKLAGEVIADPASGRLSVRFENNPQLPFEAITMHLFGGSLGALRTPAVCGTLTSHSVLVPWTAPDAPPAFPSDSYTIEHAPSGGECPGSEAQIPNAPSLDAGAASPFAGAASTFVVDLRREDGTQPLSALSMTAPPGLTARISGIPFCPQEDLERAAGRSGTGEIANPSCPAGSRLGDAYVAAGAGPAPYHLEGSVYLTGPYESAPFGLAAVIPAVGGPFDLGTVVVRMRIYVDPETAQLRIVSAPLPTILAGIPLDLRQVAIYLDRPGFIRNPTSCDPMPLTATVTMLGGATVDLANRFQLGDCDALGFRPSVSMMLSGALARNGHPSLKVVLTAKPGQAAIARAALALPVTELLEYAGIRDVCSRASYAAAGGGGEGCPPASRYGYAQAFTPLLDRPLEGPLYLRSNDGQRRLPDLVASLGGESHLDLVAHTSSVHGLLRETFVGLPDMPLSRVVLLLHGGRH